jgi:hypothetical protein
MIEVVLSQGVPAEHWPDAEFSEIVRLAGAENLTAWIEHLREAEYLSSISASACSPSSVKNSSGSSSPL